MRSLIMALAGTALIVHAIPAHAQAKDQQRSRLPFDYTGQTGHATLSNSGLRVHGVAAGIGVQATYRLGAGRDVGQVAVTG